MVLGLVSGQADAWRIADQNAGHDWAVMDSPPSLRIFPYHVCETSQVNEVPGR